MKISQALLFAAVTGIMAGSGQVYAAHAGDQEGDASTTAAGDKHACKGMNSCKGKGSCKTDANACKGKNECKGKGGCATAKHECKGKNDCKGQGAGGKNECKGKGDCKVPPKDMKDMKK
ncbi:MAG: hypothetical protein H0V44_04910 [Planctomycetes bacterium]|nr:hypothetical protein [Planctomycetota bacterium]